MKGDLTNFIVYISAMLGVIFIVAIIAKKTLVFGVGKKPTRFLSIESSLNLEPRKNLYVVKAGYERFLISSGIEGCQFMAKIEDGNIPSGGYSKTTTVVEAPDINKPNTPLRKNKPEIPLELGIYGGR